MDSSIKDRIAPMVPNNSQTFSDAAIKNPTSAKDGDPKIDFKTLLQTSNSDTARERVAKNPKDLSQAKTDADFYKILNDRANPNSNAPKNKLDKDDFLKLFVAQLRNQDPLKPDDAAQMAAQLAQFNGLEQMMNVNKNLENLTRLQEGGQAVGLLDYVGKEVSVEGGRLMINKGELTEATYTLDQPTAGAELEVRDSSGLVISSKPLGIMQQGEHQLTWDGIKNDGEKAKDGSYSFAVVAQGLDGTPMPASIKSKVRITGVDMKDPGGSFYTEMGKISVGEISSVGVPGFVARNKATGPVVPAPQKAKDAQPVGEDGIKVDGDKPVTDKGVIDPAALKRLEAQMNGDLDSNAQNQQKGPDSASPNAMPEIKFASPAANTPTPHAQPIQASQSGVDQTGARDVAMNPS